MLSSDVRLTALFAKAAVLSQRIVQAEEIKFDFGGAPLDTMAPPAVPEKPIIAVVAKPPIKIIAKDKKKKKRRHKHEKDTSKATTQTDSSSAEHPTKRQKVVTSLVSYASDSDSS